MRSIISADLLNPYRVSREWGFLCVCPGSARLRYLRQDFGRAKELVKDAIAGYIESLKKHGEPIPDDESLATTLHLEYGETTRR